MRRFIFIFLFFPQLILAQNYSYIWGMHFPNLIDPSEECCFDYTGDGNPDNKLGEVLADFDSTGNLQSSIDTAILSNSIVKAFNWQNLDLSMSTQQFNFQFLTAENDTPNLDLIERMSGFTKLYISSNQNENFFAAEHTDGLLTGTAQTINGILNLQFDEDQGLVPLTLQDVKIQAQLIDSPLPFHPGIYTDDLSATTPEVVGGMKIGGILTSDEFLGVLDDQYRTCECAGVNPAESLITTSIFLGTLLVSCDQSGLMPENCESQSFCSTINDFCDNTLGLGLTFDIDSDDDNVKDAYSVGLRYGVSATTVEIIFRHSFED